MMELQQKFPTALEVRHLAWLGFSGEEIADLFRVKLLYLQGGYHESTPEYKRQEFIRWLYQQGRLQS